MSTSTSHSNKRRAVSQRNWGTASLFHDPALLAGFTPRSTDVLITTAPKAGTTWMQQILYQLRSGGDDRFESIFDVVPWLECPQPGKSTEAVLRRYEAMPAPRIFKTHCTYEQTPGIDTVKVVLTSRDPRDCCVSYYHHMLGLSPSVRDSLGIGAEATFDELFERWLELGAWFRNVQSWWPHRQDSNVLWLRYEDLKHDLVRGVDTLLNFLGWTLGADQKAVALEHCSFAWMKQHQGKFSSLPGKSMTSATGAGSLVRKGAVGDYKTVLSEEQERRIIEKAARELEPECLSFLGLTPR